MNVVPRNTLAVSRVLRRNFGFTAVAAQKGQATDPIQKLFVQKIREYDQKKKASPGKLVDASPEIQAELKMELERVAKMYGGGAGVDMTKFPSFKFEDPPLDPISVKAS